MNYIIAGAAGGILMASAFLAVAPVMLFVIAKHASPKLAAILDRVPVRLIMIGTVVIGYPIWALIGASIGLLCWAIAESRPDQSLGNSHLIFAAVIAGMGAAIAYPFILALKKVLVGTILLTLVFVVIFGWLVPFLATI